MSDDLQLSEQLPEGILSAYDQKRYNELKAEVDDLLAGRSFEDIKKTKDLELVRKIGGVLLKMSALEAKISPAPTVPESVTRV